MLEEKEKTIRRLIIILDALLVIAAFAASYKMKDAAAARFGVPGLGAFKLSRAEAMALPAVAAVVWVLTLASSGFYRSFQTGSYGKTFKASVRSAFLAFLAMGTLIYVFKLQDVSRAFTALFGALSFGAILAAKTAFFAVTRYARRRGFSFRRLLVVGTGRRAARFIRRVRQHPEWGLQIVGAVDDEPGSGIGRVDAVPVIGGLQEIGRIFRSEAVDEVVFIVPRARLDRLGGAVRACETEGVVITLALDLFDLELARPTLTSLGGTPFLSFKTTVSHDWQLVIKCGLDIIVSSLALLAAAPVMAVVALAIKVTTRGPVLFKQHRLGLRGRVFTLYKFRTMRCGAEKALSGTADPSEMDGDAFRKEKERWITPVGRVLRKFSVDELPQLLNVLLGHMSLVGPRPTVPDEAAKYAAWQRRRLSMKPGLTCLWQVRGRNNIGFEDWMKLDLQYLDHWNLRLDFLILLKTIPAVLLGSGAY